tara:strand:+ start:117 stop:761 length:645 start_codon:yes stop_codon:yes gene_type:complete
MSYESTIGITKAHDGNVSRGHGRTSTGHPAQGTTQGQSRPMYQYPELGEGEELDPEIDILDDLDVDVINAIHAATDTELYTNPNRSGRADRGSLTGRNMAMEGMSEEFEHTTTAVRGLSPRITYRQKGPTGTVPRNNKGPAFGAQSTAQYIRSAPGRKGGTHFGTARAPLPRHDEYDENIFSLMDLKDPMERSFLNQQKRVNKIKNMVNLIEKE